MIDVPVGENAAKNFLRDLERDHSLSVLSGPVALAREGEDLVITIGDGKSNVQTLRVDGDAEHPPISAELLDFAKALRIPPNRDEDVPSVIRQFLRAR